MSKPLREQMPIVTEFIDACRLAFGKEMVDAQIQLGRQGAETFYANENDIEIGTKCSIPRVSITADRMVLRSEKEQAEINKLRKKFIYE